MNEIEDITQAPKYWLPDAAASTAITAIVAGVAGVALATFGIN